MRKFIGLVIKKQVFENEGDWVNYWERKYPSFKNNMDFKKLEGRRGKILKVVNELIRFQEKIPYDYMFKGIGMSKKQLRLKLKSIIKYLKENSEGDCSYYESRLSFDNFVFGGYSPKAIVSDVIIYLIVKQVREIYSDTMSDRSLSYRPSIDNDFNSFRIDFLNSIIVCDS